MPTYFSYFSHFSEEITLNISVNSNLSFQVHIKKNIHVNVNLATGIGLLSCLCSLLFWLMLLQSNHQASLKRRHRFQRKAANQWASAHPEALLRSHRVCGERARVPSVSASSTLCFAIDVMNILVSCCLPYWSSVGLFIYEYCATL